MGRTAFISIAAAEMNLGDIFIRRAITRLIAANGRHAVVYTGSMGSSYVEAFELPESWVVTDSPRRFLPLLLRACAQRRAVVIMAPAPALLDVSPLILAKKVFVAVLLTIACITGNQVVIMGRSLRGSGRLALAAERAMARASALCLVRDPLTADLIGPPAKFSPDLGFARTAMAGPADQHGGPRTTVALSFRFDHLPDTELVNEFVQKLKAQGLDTIVVTQVRQDRDVHEALARACDIAHVDWPQTRTHLDQEAAVAAAYRSCIAVVSNRLHALVIGGRCGAVPVIADRSADRKLHPTLDDLIKPQSVWLHGERDKLGDNGIDVSDDEVARTRAAFADAAATLEPALLELVHLLAD